MGSHAPPIRRLVLRALVPLSLWLCACGASAPPVVEKPPPPPPPVVDEGPPPPIRYALAPELQAVVERSDKNWPAENVPLDQKTCRKLSGWPADLMECWLESRANGTAAQLVMQTTCAADTCEFETWLFAGGTAKPQRPVADELSLDHAVAYEEEVVFSANEAVIVGKRLVRVERESRRRKKFAACFSPSVSPAGHWILCRDRQANVIAVPAQGGEARVIIPSKVRAEHVLWKPEWYDYPSKVWFEGAGVLHYRMDMMPELPRSIAKRRAQLEGPFSIEWSE